MRPNRRYNKPEAKSASSSMQETDLEVTDWSAVPTFPSTERQAERENYPSDPEKSFEMQNSTGSRGKGHMKPAENTNENKSEKSGTIFWKKKDGSLCNAGRPASATSEWTSIGKSLFSGLLNPHSMPKLRCRYPRMIYRNDTVAVEYELSEVDAQLFISWGENEAVEELQYTSGIVYIDRIQYDHILHFSCLTKEAGQKYIYKPLALNISHNAGYAAHHYGHEETELRRRTFVINSHEGGRYV